jgi:hypothetical protein
MYVKKCDLGLGQFDPINQLTKVCIIVDHIKWLSVYLSFSSPNRYQSI